MYIISLNHATNSVLDVYFTLEEYTSSEADEQMIISVCKSKRTSAYFSVEMLVGSVTDGNDSFYDSLSIPALDDDSPNRATS